MALQLPSLPGASATRPGKQGAMPPRITGSASAAIAVLGTGGVIGSTVSAAGPGVYASRFAAIAASCSRISSWEAGAPNRWYSKLILLVYNTIIFEYRQEELLSFNRKFLR